MNRISCYLQTFSTSKAVKPLVKQQCRSHFALGAESDEERERKREKKNQTFSTLNSCDAHRTNLQKHDVISAPRELKVMSERPEMSIFLFVVEPFIFQLRHAVF